jgi:3-phenylpropionate/cinnamic acid dioxygenase small subunit
MTSTSSDDDLATLRAELRALRDLEEIKALKARYCRLVDAQDWDGWLDTVLTEDVVLTLEGRAVEGHEGVRAMIEAVLVGATTVHHVHAPEITLTEPDTATGTWAMDDLVHLVRPKERRFHGHGHYHETYVRTPAGWRIAASELTRLRVDEQD